MGWRSIRGGRVGERCLHPPRRIVALRALPADARQLAGPERPLLVELAAAGAKAALVPLLPGRHPEHLELVGVGVAGVQAEAVAVIGFADKGAGSDEGVPNAGQVLDALELPGGVVHADLAAGGGRWRVGSDAEQTEVVMVV